MKVRLERRMFRNPSFMTGILHIDRKKIDLGEDHKTIMRLTELLPMLKLESLTIDEMEIDYGFSPPKRQLTSKDVWEQGRKK